MKKVLAIMIFAFVVLTPVALADGTGGLVPACEGVTCTICHLVTLAHNIIKWLTQFAFAVAIFAVAIGGYVWATSAGSEERVKQGRKIITSAAIGLFIVLAAWVIVNTIIQVLVGGSQSDRTKFPFPWNSIPDDCNAPVFPAAPAGGGQSGGNSSAQTAPAVAAPNPAGALEPQGPTVTGPNGEVHAPTAPEPETFGPSRDLMSTPPSSGSSRSLNDEPAPW